MARILHRTGIDTGGLLIGAGDTFTYTKARPPTADSGAFNRPQPGCGGTGQRLPAHWLTGMSP